jgi:subtilisin family serine protease
VPPAPVQPPLLPPRAVAGALVPDEVLVTIDGDAALAAAIAAASNLEVRGVRTSALLGATLVRYGIPDGRPVGVVLAQIDADGRGGVSEPNHLFDLQQESGFPQYAFERISLDAGEASGRDVAVAVIDSGVDDTHPALRGVVAARHDSLPEQPERDRNHGTAIVGLIAAHGAVRGVAPGASIHHSRAFEFGRSTMDAILDSLDWAALQDVRIINMSFAGPRNGLMQRALEAARLRGIVLVAAAGNGGPKAPHAFPAAFDSVIAVTATDYGNRLMPEANRGPYVFISAPGVEVVAPVPGGTDFLTGTSMASAILAGAIANLIRADPTRTPADIERALRATAIDLGPPGRDTDFGFGLVNYRAALAGGRL